MLGLNIKEIRDIRKISAAELANRIGVSAAAVSKWETGTSSPRYDKIQAICDVLNIPVSLFYTWEPDSWYKTLDENELNQICNDFKDAESLTYTSIYKFLYESESDLGKLYRSFDSLNETGKEEAIKRVNELTEIPKYIKKKD